MKERFLFANIYSSALIYVYTTFKIHQKSEETSNALFGISVFMMFPMIGAVSMKWLWDVFLCCADLNRPWTPRPETLFDDLNHIRIDQAVQRRGRGATRRSRSPTVEEVAWQLEVWKNELAPVLPQLKYPFGMHVKCALCGNECDLDVSDTMSYLIEETVKRYRIESGIDLETDGNGEGTNGDDNDTTQTKDDDDDETQNNEREWGTHCRNHLMRTKCCQKPLCESCGVKVLKQCNHCPFCRKAPIFEMPTVDSETARPETAGPDTTRA